MLPSASLLPAETDPSVLFNTAGMQQFKRYYSEPEVAPSARITTSQKCLRTGDIDEVGDNTHLTFFEMLGNFSFGYPDKENSYFKKEAIEFAWDFLTKELGFDTKRIYATYFKGENDVPVDAESLQILQSIDGLGKIVPQGFSDNFWSLGTENSPGGPTVEFYIDDVEIWNLVFNEYVYQNGKYVPAKLRGIDTGMGLERLATMVDGKDNVYETALFQPLIIKLTEISGLKYLEHRDEFRVIVDHAKAAVFSINDGIVPSNKDAGYVVRRLIRRAIVKTHQLKIDKNFLIDLSREVFAIYKDSYKFNEKVVLDELEKEEVKFRKTLNDGLKHLIGQKEITAKILFDLYQSFGLPLEISLEEAEKLNFTVNDDLIAQYKKMVSEHQELSRTASAGMFKGGLAEAGEMTTKYHTATHLLQAALRQVLGSEIFQRGSNITPERMRFDFSYPEKLTSEQIGQIENIVNEKIAENLPVTMEEMTLEEAKRSGALGIFESKYGEKVKVYTIGEFSKEICGGPHVEHTGDLGHFKILKEESSSAGVRRIKAVLE